jgi:hypothetical protein
MVGGANPTEGQLASVGFIQRRIRLAPLRTLLPLPRDALEKLGMVLPTSEELATVKAFRGTRGALMECDKFFFAVADVPRFGARDIARGSYNAGCV